MIAKEVLEAVRPFVYHEALMTADGSVLSREDYIRHGIDAVWREMISRVPSEKPPVERMQVEAFLFVLSHLAPEYSIRRSDGEVILHTPMYEYLVLQGRCGVIIASCSPLIIPNIDHFSGITPIGPAPEQLMARIFMVFDHSIPEIKRFLDEVEFEAMRDYKMHCIRKETITAILKPLLDPPDMDFIIGMNEETTVCKVFIGDWTVFFEVNDDNMGEMVRSLSSDMARIIGDPQAARSLGQYELGYKLY